MMTLDEVIIGIKEQMGLGDPILIDALYYLKEYQKLLFAKPPTTQKKSVDQIEEDLHGRI